VLAFGEGCRVRYHLEAALQVRAPDQQARYRGKVLESDGMRMAVLVVRAAADQPDSGHDRGQQSRRGA
jgi:hypothetical protein